MTTECIVILVSILVVIVLGYFLKINYGFLGIIFAFIGGCMICGFSASKVIGFWPTRLFFQMFSVTFFYAFALNNGTMEALTKKLVYVSRKSAAMIPFLLFLVGGVLAGIGPGSISMFLILVPVIMQVGRQVGMHPILAAVTASCGINAGAWGPLAVNGITIRGLIETSGYSAEQATAFGMVEWRNMAVASIVIFVIVYLITKGWKCHALSAEKPAAFTKEQTRSVALIAILTALLIIPPALNSMIGGPAFKWLATNLDATFLAILFGVLSIIFKVGDEKKAIANVPWPVIIMVGGMGMLISVAAEAGAMTYLSEYISGNLSVAAIPYAICIVAGVMSVFSSTMGVVVPTLYPIIFAICTATGASPALLFSIVPISAANAGTSPFSLFGGLAMASTDEKDKDKMFMYLLIVAIASVLLVCLLTAVGIINS